VRTFRKMPLMKITGQGVCSIAVLTGILWGCLVVERLTIAHARVEGYRALEQIHELQLKKSIIPTASPAAQPRPTRPLVG
jgi:hypothetical protein